MRYFIMNRMIQAAYSGDPAVSKQIDLVQEEMSQAHFDHARTMVTELDQKCPEADGKLFAVYARIKLDLFEDVRRPVDGDLDSLELAQGSLANRESWPLHWYIQSWFMAPLLNSHPVDVFYLYYLCTQLKVVSQRQDCLIQAMQYAVQYSEDGFIKHLNQLYPFDETWIAATFYRSMMESLRAAHTQDCELMSKTFAEMEKAAENPLHKFEILQLRKRFSHLLDS